MDLKHKVVPFVLSGTLAFGGMIVPAKATAIDATDKGLIDHGRQLYQQYSQQGADAWESVRQALEAEGFEPDEAAALIVSVQNALAEEQLLEAERVAAEQAAQAEAERITAEQAKQAAQAEADRLAAEQAAQAEAERIARERAAAELAAVNQANAEDEARARAAADAEQRNREAAAYEQQLQNGYYVEGGEAGVYYQSGYEQGAEAATVYGGAPEAESAVVVPAPDGSTVTETSTSNVFASQAQNQDFQIVRYSQNLSTEMFIATIGEQARQIGQQNNLYASVMIAQAILESGSGSSSLSKAPNNNLFGIKGSFQGQSVNLPTSEDDGTGSLYGIDADFRRYDTQKQSLNDYAALLRNDPYHYAAAWKENAATPEAAAQALEGTYATSTLYAESLCGLIETYDLKRYDEPLPFELAGQIEENGQMRDLTMDDYANLETLAVAQLGIPYTWGGNTPDQGFDCSGLVSWLHANALGIGIARTTYDQQHQGVEVAFDDLQMGDLLFFSEGGSTEHVAMYLGEGFYIHAPEPGDVVKVASMESYMPSFAKRMYATQPAGTRAASAAATAPETNQPQKPKVQQYMPVAQKPLSEILAGYQKQKAQNATAPSVPNEPARASDASASSATPEATARTNATIRVS